MKFRRCSDQEWRRPDDKCISQLQNAIFVVMAKINVLTMHADLTDLTEDEAFVLELGILNVTKEDADRIESLNDKLIEASK